MQIIEKKTSNLLKKLFSKSHPNNPPFSNANISLTKVPIFNVEKLNICI